MVRDLKAKRAERKDRILQKLEKKGKKLDKKLDRRVKAGKVKDDDADPAENVDLDAILLNYQREQEQFLKVSESPSEPPTPRSSATLVASPSNSAELFLFGGERYTAGIATFYNDLFVYKINQDAWRKVTSPNTPLPRSGHAMCQGGNSGGIYLFGGEFSSPKQGTFYHYNDFWRLDPSTREWAKLEAKNGPPARSGHRMAAFRNYIVLFGGFQDTSQQTKYLQDVWLYDTQRYTWHSPVFNAAVQKPIARSSFSMLPHDGGIVIFGGYSRVKATEVIKGQSKAAKPGSKVVMKPMVHQDTWLLRITPAASDAPTSAPPTVRWERRKRPINTPNPPRAGATMTHHKGRGILFGGVHDVEDSEESIDSQFFNLLFAYNIDRNRFFPLSLRRPRTNAKKAPAAADRGRRDRGRADVEELMRNLALIEGRGPGAESGDLDERVALQLSALDDDPENTNGDDDTRPEKPVLWEMPRARFNAQLTVQDDTLYIFGGTFEKGDGEYTFDEMWAVDLGRLDGMKEVFRRDLADWQDSDDDDDDEDDDDDDDDASDGDDHEYASDDFDDDATTILSASDDTLSTISSASHTTPRGPSRANTGFGGLSRAGTMDTGFGGLSRTGTTLTDISGITRADTMTITDSEAAEALSDAFPHPRPFESLRDFFQRTSTEWQEAVLEAMKYERDVEDRSVKEIRKKAFDRAERKWWDSREEIQALEDEQEAAGIGEVVSLSQRGEGGGGGPMERRR